MIIDEVRAAYVKDLIKTGARADGRGLMDYRPITVKKDVLWNAEGSAQAQVGDTKVLAAVKFDLIAPFSDRPDEGVLMFNCEFAPLAHPDFQAGPPDERSIELARFVDRGIRSADVVDLAELGALKSSEGKVMGVFVDLHVLDHCGNLTDCASLAAMAALSCAKMPKLENNKLVRTEFSGPLELKRRVTSCTFEMVTGTPILDATLEEEAASEGRLSVSVTDDGFVCSGQKSGRGGLKKEELLSLVDKSFEKGTSDLIKYV